MSRVLTKADAEKAALEKSRHLWTSDGAYLTLTRAEFRAILLATDGTIIRRGHLCDLRGKHLGAGVYRVTAERRP